MKKYIIAVCLALIAIGGVAGSAYAGGNKTGFHQKMKGHVKVHHKWKRGHRRWHRKWRRHHKWRKPHYGHYSYYRGYCWKFKRRYRKTGNKYWLDRFYDCKHDY